MIDLDAIDCVAAIPAAQAAARCEAVAILFEGRTTTYAELAERSRKVAAGLAAAGVVPGDRIAALTRNHDSWFEVFFGTALARACFTPVNCRLAAGEIATILADAAPRILFVGEDLIEIARAALAGIEVQPQIIMLSGAAAGAASLTAWRDAAAPNVAIDAPQPDDDVLQLYTSGTTGKPKGVVLTNRNYRRFLEMMTGVDGFAYEADETVMMVMPLFHVAGTNVSFAALAQGCRLVLVRDFTPATALATMTSESVAHAFLAPAMILMMLQSPALAVQRFGALRTIAYGASPIAEDVLARATVAFGCGFVQFYGMTESTGAGSYLSPAAHVLPGRLKSCGRAWPGVEVAVVDPEGTPLPAGEIGEFVIRGDIVMKGYWNRVAATAETLAGGWLHTGDAGYVDAEGFFYVHDRIKDMIVSGGENIYPAEVENALHGCPGVADVAVIGVPDEKWGEAVKALVVADGQPPTADAVIDWARARIAAFKVPKSVDFVAALPRNASGKVLRRKLRDPYWAGRDRAVG